jgi:NADPH-dependent curcumin reductase
MTDRTLQRVTLNAPITGAPHPEDFDVMESPIPPLGEGEALFATRFVSVDPGTRSRLSAGASYARPLRPGETVDGFCVGEVIESRNPKFVVGEAWAYGGGWASHTVTNGRGYLQKLPPGDLPQSLWIGVLGVPGMTAYFGLKRVAGLQAGERMLVTSAAGPVGATAGQLARHWGASAVVGVAGGPVKGAWVKDVAGFDACIDYKAPGFDLALAKAFPEGIDVLFDNVGAAMIDRVLPLMRPGGRIVVSGQVADYNDPDPPGLKGGRWFIASRLRMEGLVVFDDLKGFPTAQAEVAAMIAAGKLAYREERFQGLERAPEAFCGLFTGESFGRRIVEIA